MCVVKDVLVHPWNRVVVRVLQVHGYILQPRVSTVYSVYQQQYCLCVCRVISWGCEISQLHNHPQAGLCLQLTVVAPLVGIGHA